MDGILIILSVSDSTRCSEVRCHQALTLDETRTESTILHAELWSSNVEICGSMAKLLTE